jgi:hypothetical protein
MSKITIELAPEEFDRMIIALEWYIDDREECAVAEERGIYDAGADESREAAQEASHLLEKLRGLI